MRPSNFDPSYGDILGGSVSVAITKLADGRAILKQSVRGATTGAITLATGLEAGDTIDGLVLAEGDRILVWQQADATENGIYSVEASGAPTRTLDADTGEELLGAYVTILDGTVNAGKLFHNVNTTAPVLGTDNVLFEELTLTIPAGTYLLTNEGEQPLINALGSVTGAQSIDPTLGNIVTLTMTGDTTATIAAPVGSGGSSMEYWVTQDGTGGWDLTMAATAGTVTDDGTITPDTTAGVTVRYILERVPGTTNDWVRNIVGGGATALTVEDEGTPLATAADTLDFVGAGVTASGTGSTKTITIPGGGDPADDTQVWMPLTSVDGGEPVLVWDGDDSLIPDLVPV